MVTATVEEVKKVEAVKAVKAAESSLLLVEATVAWARLALGAVLVLLEAYSQPVVAIFAQAASLLVHVLPAEEKVACLDLASKNML